MFQIAFQNSCILGNCICFQRFNLSSLPNHLTLERRSNSLDSEMSEATDLTVGKFGLVSAESCRNLHTKARPLLALQFLSFQDQMKTSIGDDIKFIGRQYNICQSFISVHRDQHRKLQIRYIPDITVE